MRPQTLDSRISFRDKRAHAITVATVDGGNFTHRLAAAAVHDV